MVAIPPLHNQTIEAIDRAVERQATPYLPATIGGSTIGHKCERYLWYRFRWAAAPETHEGRMLRLFETGHKEEARMIGWLRDAGCVVHDIDPQTGRQWKVLACGGHFKGYTDGVVKGLKEAPETAHLLECKTHNLKSFEQLQKHGVAIAKPEHVDQMQSYMHLMGLTRAFYLAKCKDNDALYGERINYDAAHACALMAKAERIINAHDAPPRVSDKPDYFLCKAYRCPFYDTCHQGGRAEYNCRTCLHSSPVGARGGESGTLEQGMQENGQWHCERHDRLLSYDDQQAGCPNHLFLPALVNGEQIDVDEEHETVTYKMRDGSTWIDGGMS